MNCLNCKKETHNKKFCSKLCSNTYQIDKRSKANGSGPAKEKKKCTECGQLLAFSAFSYVNKFDVGSGTREMCKRCSHSLTEKNRRERDWKYNTKKIMINKSLRLT